MDMSYNPERGFFVGEGAKYCLALFGALAILLMPALIKADGLPQAANGTAALPSRTVWITAYASVPEETSSHPFITASGAMVGDGVIAANFLPFGTLVKIPQLFGDKVFVVKDRMNRMFSKRVDIWMPTVREAVDFGIRRATIVILGGQGDSLVAEK